jgi:2-polyprenyl-6-hydroxyphenyl methylase / 3-demethylubiquinone-9 3-methyltransferase
VPLDNTLYDRLAHTWWAEDGILQAMGPLLNPGRLRYFCDVLFRRLGMKPAGLRVLDVGCGGGSLAEEFARRGCRVVGLDPSEPSIVVARRHAAGAGLAVDYLVGRAEALPFATGHFDVVICADALEHVQYLEGAVAESARVLRPGGGYLYETVNRTILSWLVAIKLLQDWPPTRLLPPNIHAFEKFIRPAELRELMDFRGIEPRDMTGLWPNEGPVKIVLTALRLKLGRIAPAEAALRLALQASRRTAMSYAGYGVRRGERAR